MRRRISRLGIVVVSVIALVNGSSNSAPAELEGVGTAVECENMEAALNWLELQLDGCEGRVDCGELEIWINDLSCSIAECWDALDGVCSAAAG